MKLNKEIYKEVFSKVVISQELEEKLVEIPNSVLKKNKPTKKIIAFLVAAIIVVLSGVSVFAGVNLYNFYTVKHGKYAEDLIIQKNTENANTKNNIVMSLSKRENVKQPEFVKIKFNYLPEFFTKQTHTRNIVKFNYKNKKGITFDIIDVFEENEIILSKESLIDSEVTALGGNSVYYFEQLSDSADEDPFNKHIYMYISKYDYLVHGYVGSTVPKKLVYKIFDNLSLIECEEWESHNISDWIEPENEEVHILQEGNNTYYSKNNHYIQVGDTQKISKGNHSNIEVTVDDIKISNDLSMMDDSFKNKYLDKSGKLKPLKVDCYGGGDGINSLSELKTTKYYDMVYIYETVTYKNTSDKDINDYCIYHKIVSPPENIYVTYDVFENLKSKYELVSYDLNYEYRIGEWAYDSFSKSATNSTNCIDIPANSEVTVNIGFFVTEETLKEDLWIEVYQGYSIDGGSGAEEAILVDVSQ